LLLGYVLPHVELGPVGDRKDPRMLPLADAAIVEAPHLRSLALRFPLTELVAEGEHALLRPRALLVAASAAERGVEAVLGDRVEQRDRLQPVARGAGTRLVDHPATPDRLLDGRHDQALADFGHPPVAELDRLREVVAGI